MTQHLQSRKIILKNRGIQISICIEFQRHLFSFKSDIPWRGVIFGLPLKKRVNSTRQFAKIGTRASTMKCLVIIKMIFSKLVENPSVSSRISFEQTEKYLSSQDETTVWFQKIVAYKSKKKQRVWTRSCFISCGKNSLTKGQENRMSEPAWNPLLRAKFLEWKGRSLVFRLTGKWWSEDFSFVA